MSLFKMKRGQESKVSSLAKEDGSLIFSLNGANDSTLRLDQSVSGTVQRLGVAVDKAKSADGVIDYNEPTRHIKIGYAGAGLSTSNLTHIAGYTNNGTQIKDVSKDVLKNWLGALDSANKLNPTVTLTNEGSNTSGYRLIATISLNAQNNYRAVFITRSRHQGAGYLTITVGNNSNSITYDNAYSEITYWGPVGSGSVIASDSYQVRVSSDGKKAYVFWKYWDYSPTAIYVISSDFTIFNGTWMTSIAEATYGKVKAYTSINNAQSLQGSSLSQILNAVGNSNAFTDLDTSINNKIKLTRANGDVVEKTINNVSNASSASFASTATLASTATNASTADYVKSAAPSAGSLNYVQVLNSSNINGSASYTVNELAKHHFAQGMINAAIDNPLGKTGWVHVQSMAWTNGSDQWASQLALDVQDGSGMYYRSSAAGGHLAGRSWNKLLDNTNYTDYAADRTAFSGVSISGQNITLTRANGGTVKITTQDSNTTYPVHEGVYDASFASSFRSESFGTVANGWHLAAVRTDVANVSYAPQHGSGIAWAREDTHGYLYVDHSGANAYIGGGNANRLNWQKQLAFLDSTVANATSAKNASHLGGKVASDYALKTDLSGDINALSAKRLPSYQSVSVANSFFYRYGTAGNIFDGGAWTGFPSATLYSKASTANGFGSALFRKKVGVLHLAAGSSAHDLVFQAGGTNGGIAYVATGRNPAYVLDTLNYKDKAYTFNKLTAASTFTATSGVVIDGGSY